MGGKRFLFLSLILLAGVGGLGSPGLAQIQRITGAENALEGLTTVHFRLQYYEEGVAREAAPDAARLRKDLERILTDSGLKVVPMNEFERLVASRSYPIALVETDVRMSKIPDSELKAYVLLVKVRQAAFLSRKPVITFLASSWESTDFGAAHEFAFVRDVAIGAVGRFAQEWKTLNGK